ncbi:MAG: MalY/PatB family protein [Anaerococcus sp.]|nr:MalY/PatB family protein [Anaerococcus sp.]
MKYDFENYKDRSKLGSAKWLDMIHKKRDVDPKVVPLSVADMEFVHPDNLIDGLKEYLDETILGYTLPRRPYFEAVINFMKERHDFDIKKEWIVNTGGVVPAIFNAIRVLTDRKDGVIIMPPVYYPFFNAINRQGRDLVECPLIEKDNTYEIDFDLFEKLAKEEKNKVLLFCSPHNPVGRVWRKDELQRLGQIIIENDLYLLSDEIHFDLIMPGFNHTVFQTISDQLADRTITMTAPTKSFNLAGLGVSNIIIKNEKLRERFNEGLLETSHRVNSALGFKAGEIVYNDLRDWLDECIGLIDENRAYIKDFFEKNYPEIKVFDLEGTYLLWVDFRALGLGKDDLEDFMINKASLFLDEGYIFGKGGEGFERINLAAPKKVIVESMERLDKALKDLKKDGEE